MTQISQATDEFESYLYTITHDLKSFSRAMRTIPDWIAEDLVSSGTSLPIEVAEHITMLQHYANGMDKMLDGLTELSRIGRLVHAPSRINLGSALELAWSDTTNTDGFSMECSLPVVAVLAPESDIQRILRAVLNNCVVHHDKGKGNVRVSGHLKNNQVILEVADDGPGIAMAYREKVFEPLHTLCPKDETGFSGLGLTIARKVASTLGGKIEVVDNAPTCDRGCTVRCNLPAG